MMQRLKKVELNLIFRRDEAFLKEKVLSRRDEVFLNVEKV